MSDRVNKPGGRPAKGSSTPSDTSRGEVEITVGGVRIDLTPELEALVHRARKGLLAPLPAEMTTTQAAEFLDVSRPFVIKLITNGELPCRMVGKHRRVPTQALEAYKEKMFRRAKRAADEMSRISQDLGLDDTGESAASL
jgi:excisionase family DNA binding protein